MARGSSGGIVVHLDILLKLALRFTLDLSERMKRTWFVVAARTFCDSAESPLDRHSAYSYASHFWGRGA